MLIGALLPATSAGAASAHVSAHAVALSFKVGTPVQVAGSVTPGSTAAVALQRLVGKSWVTVAHGKPSAAGAFTLSVKAPSKPATWKVRVVRPKAGKAAAITGASFTVRVVKSAYSVTAVVPATVVTGSPTIVTGKVAPKATGTVVLQTTGPSGWYTFASAKLSATSTFALAGTLPLGAHSLRVLKAASKTVAQGLSKSTTTTVTVPPIPALSVATTALPDAVVESSYAIQLAASGGVPPYTWSASGLPAGVTVSAGGLIGGRIGSVGTATPTLTVTDARLSAASVTLSLRASLSPQAVNLGHGWGSNGGLGVNQSGADVTRPATIGLSGLTEIAPLNSAAVGLRFNGDVWAWGNNGLGILGVSPTTLANTLVPVQVPGLHDVSAVAASDSSAYALTADGTVLAWGYNTFGQLGNGSMASAASPTPSPVVGLTGVTAITASAGSGYALKQDGTVWAWGFNFYGQLGDGTTTSRSLPVQVQGFADIKQISANSNGYQVEALRKDGTVWMLGHNGAGQLGDGTTTDRLTAVQVVGLSNVTQVASAGNTSFALLTSGTVMGWGSNSGGQVGDGTGVDRSSPVSVIGGVAAVFGGGQVAFAVLTDGTAVDWGYNGNSEIGDGTNTTRPAPVPIPGLTHVRQMSGNTFSSFAVTGP